MHTKLLQLCPTLCDPMDYSPPEAPLSMGFSRQEYWIRLPCPSPGSLPNPGIKPMSLTSSALIAGFFTTISTWEVPLDWGSWERSAEAEGPFLNSITLLHSVCQVSHKVPPRLKGRGPRPHVLMASRPKDLQTCLTMSTVVAGLIIASWWGSQALDIPITFLG